MMSPLLNKFFAQTESISWTKYFLLIVGFSGIVFFAGIDAHGLWGGDEPRVAGIAADMVYRGDWLIPMLNGKPFLEKPPLYFWSVACSLDIFGHHDFAAKLPSAVAAFFGVLAVFAFARRMKFSKLGALFAAVMLATSAQYWESSSKCMLDIFLAMFVILSIWCFYELSLAGRFAHQVLWYLGFCLALAGSILSKSLVGLAIPASALFVWLAVDDFWLKHKFSPKRWAWLFSASALAFIPVALWTLAVYFRYGHDGVYTLVWTNNFGRFLGSGGEHVEPIYYYLRKLPEQLQPWTVLLPLAVFFYGWRVWKKRDEKSLLMLCWLFMPYLLLTLSAGKRQVYVLPLYAAETLMIGSFAACLLKGNIFKILPEEFDWIEWLVKIFSWIFCSGLLIAPIIFAVIALYHNLSWIAYPAQVLLFGCGICAFYFMKKRIPGMTGLAMLAGLAMVYVNIDTTIFNLLDRKHSYRPLFDSCKVQITAGKQLYLHSPRERLSGAAMFYLGKTFPSISTEELKTLRKDLKSENTVFLSEDENILKLKNVSTIAVFKVKHDKLYLFKLQF